MQKKDEKDRKKERYAYIAIVVILALYGMKDSEAAVKLIESVSKALSVLLTLE
jgi:hypothetical protein